MFGFGKKKGEGKYPEDSFPPLPDDPLPGSDSNIPFNNDLPDLPSMGNQSMNQTPQMDSPNSIPQTPFQQNQPQSFQQPTSFQERNSIPREQPRIHEELKKPDFDKNDLVLAKLDNIKSMLDVLNQRLSTVESKLDNKRW